MAKKTLYERIADAYPTFVSETENMSIEELRERVTSMALLQAETTAAEEADVNLAQAKDQVKQLSADYVETKKAVKLKTRWCAKLIEERGKRVKAVE